MVVLGDFVWKLHFWCNNNVTVYEGSKTDDVTSQFGFQQISKEPTHICDSLLVIRLITTKPNLVIESGVHSYPRPNFHYDISIAKFNPKIHPSPSELEDWHYQKANVDQISQVINFLGLIIMQILM